MNLAAKFSRGVWLAIGVVLMVVAGGVVWQALAQLAWTFDSHICLTAKDYLACKANPGPAREYTDFLAFFDESFNNILFNYVKGLSLAIMAGIAVALGILGYVFADNTFRYRIGPWLARRKREKKFSEN